MDVDWTLIPHNSCCRPSSPPLQGRDYCSEEEREEDDEEEEEHAEEEEKAEEEDGT